MKFFLVGFNMIQYLEGVTKEEAAIEVCRYRNVTDGKGRYDIVRATELDDGTFYELYNDDGLWQTTTLKALLEEVEIDLNEGSDELQRKYEAAKQHIDALESKFEEAQKSLRDALNAMEAVDLDYASFDED